MIAAKALRLARNRSCERARRLPSPKRSVGNRDRNQRAHILCVDRSHVKRRKRPQTTSDLDARRAAAPRERAARRNAARATARLHLTQSSDRRSLNGDEDGDSLRSLAHLQSLSPAARRVKAVLRKVE